jgi:hypothetical protein
MARPDGIFELRRTRNHTVVVLVSVADRRIVPALHVVSRLGCSDSRALHVSVDAEATRKLAADWMDLGLSWLPLHIEEAAAEGVLASVRRAIEKDADGGDRVTVVVPELDVVRWWQPLLFRSRARRIAEELQPLPGVTTVIVPFCLMPRGSC